MKQIKGDGEMLKKQASEISCVWFSPNGKYLASGADDGKITLWNFTNRSIEGQPLIGHTSRVRRVRFSKDGNKLVSSSNDKTLMIWSVETRKCLGKLTGHTGKVFNGFFFANDTMIASSQRDGDYSVRIWDAETYKQIGDPLLGLDNDVYGLAISPDERTLVGASFNGSMKKWNINNKPEGYIINQDGGIII